jgi:2-phospho-L-lactate guanylyltransferase
VLPLEARRRLVLTMLEDVLGTIGEAATLTAVLVVTPDAEAAGLAERKGAMVLREQRAHGLNAALRAGLARARAEGAARALILPADVPLATAAELRSLLEAAAPLRRGQATLVPSRDADGTNALLLAPPDALQPAFGPGSFIRHLARAVASGLDIRVLRLPGLAADVDVPGDLEHLASCRRGSPRYASLEPYLGRVRTAPSMHPREDER